MIQKQLSLPRAGASRNCSRYPLLAKPTLFSYTQNDPQNMKLKHAYQEGCWRASAEI